MRNDNQSFIVRIWREATGNGDQASQVWRGSIDHIGSGKRFYFQDLDGIARFIREQLGLQNEEAAWRKWWKTLPGRFRL